MHYMCCARKHSFVCHSLDYSWMDDLELDDQDPVEFEDSGIDSEIDSLALSAMQVPVTRRSRVTTTTTKGKFCH